MAGLDPRLAGSGFRGEFAILPPLQTPPCPGLSRASTSSNRASVAGQDVDGRIKSGHGAPKVVISEGSATELAQSESCGLNPDIYMDPRVNPGDDEIR